jgi:peptide subunit release factor 1 (eRF1)
VSVQRALQGVVTALQRHRGPLPPTGLVLLADPEGTRVLVPPAPVPAFAYTCASRFHLDPLYDMVAHRGAPVYGVVVSDGSEARGWTCTSLPDAKREFVVASLASGRTRRGGSSAGRISRIRDEQEGAFTKRAAAAAAAAWLDGDGVPRVAGVVVAGPAGSKAAIAALLPGPLRALCLPPVPTPSMDLADAWRLSAEARSAGVAGCAAALRARVGTLRDTDPDLLVWGREEVLLALRAGVLELAVVATAEAYPEVEALAPVSASGGPDAAAGDAPGGGLLHVDPSCGLDVGILRYKCGDVRALFA